jgi:anti-anti-sigma factor
MMTAAQRKPTQQLSFASQDCNITARHEPPIMLVTIAGEIDASNADILDLPALTQAVRPGMALVLDMTRVDFLGVQGLCALLHLADECRRAGLPWALAASHAVHRLLRVGVPKGTIPTAGSVAEALQWFDMDDPSRARGRLRVVNLTD